jgi:hypothetical protein
MLAQAKGGIGTIILLIIVGWALGMNPLYLIGGAEIAAVMFFIILGGLIVSGSGVHL